jgi:hypothetical protein
MTQEGRVYRFRVVVVDLQSFNCTEKAEQVVVISFRVSAPQRPLECVVRLTYIHAPHQTAPKNKRTMSTNKSMPYRNLLSLERNANCYLVTINVEGMSVETLRSKGMEIRSIRLEKTKMLHGRVPSQRKGRPPKGCG